MDFYQNMHGRIHCGQHGRFGDRKLSQEEAEGAKCITCASQPVYSGIPRCPCGCGAEYHD